MDDYLPIIVIATVLGAVVAILPKSLNLFFYPKMALTTRKEKEASLRRVIESDRGLKIWFCVVEFFAAISIMLYLYWVISTFNGYWLYFILTVPALLFFREVLLHLFLVPTIMRRIRLAEQTAPSNR